MTIPIFQILAIAALALDPGRCVFCNSTGQRSTVSSSMTTGTMMASLSYYDENGQWVANDKNIYTTGYDCSRGHDWIEFVRYGRATIKPQRMACPRWSHAHSGGGFHEGDGTPRPAVGTLGSPNSTFTLIDLSDPHAPIS